MKKSLYKIGDKVTVSFLGSSYESEIVDVRHHPQHQDRIIYVARNSDGLIIPYVGIDGSEKYANIFTEENDKLKLKNKQNGNKRTKRKSEQSSEEAN